MRDEGAAAVDVLALVVTLFSIVSEVTARTCERCLLAYWAMHHDVYSSRP